MKTIIDMPVLYLGFAAMHLVLGQFLTQLIYQFRFKRSALAIYQAEKNRHNQISRWILVLAFSWYLSLILYAYSADYRLTRLGEPLYLLAPQWGWFIALCGMIGMLLCQYLMGESFRIGQEEVKTPALQPLQTQGIYQWSRNPIYVCSFLTLLGISLWVITALTFCLLAGLAFLIHQLVIEEEKYLSQLHGCRYSEYRRNVSRYVPIMIWRSL